MPPLEDELAQTPPDLLTLHAAANPTKPALIDDRPGAKLLVWSYAELEERANRLANVLALHGVGPRDRVTNAADRAADRRAALTMTASMSAVAAIITAAFVLLPV